MYVGESYNTVRSSSHRGTVPLPSGNDSFNTLSGTRWEHRLPRDRRRALFTRVCDRYIPQAAKGDADRLRRVYERVAFRGLSGWTHDSRVTSGVAQTFPVDNTRLRRSLLLHRARRGAEQRLLPHRTRRPLGRLVEAAGTGIPAQASTSNPLRRTFSLTVATHGIVGNDQPVEARWTCIDLGPWSSAFLAARHLAEQYARRRSQEACARAAHGTDAAGASDGKPKCRRSGQGMLTPKPHGVRIGPHTDTNARFAKDGRRASPRSLGPWRINAANQALKARI